MCIRKKNNILYTLKEIMKPHFEEQLDFLTKVKMLSRFDGREQTLLREMLSVSELSLHGSGVSGRGRQSSGNRDSARFGPEQWLSGQC